MQGLVKPTIWAKVNEEACEALPASSLLSGGLASHFREPRGLAPAWLWSTWSFSADSWEGLLLLWLSLSLSSTAVIAWG